MKKHVLLISVIAVLSLAACAKPSAPSSEDSKIDQTSIIDEGSDISEVQDSSESEEPSSNEPSSSEEPVSSSAQPSSSVEPPEVIAGANFTVNIPKDLSMMSWNCKKYVDDMRAQQKKLIQEKGANADYYLNDLYGNNGVDITKGITEGDNGGYRPANINNDYLDDVKAEWEKGEKSDENKGVNISFEPSDALKNKEYTFSYGLKEDLSDANVVTTSDTEVCLKNLLVNQKYYFKVAADGSSSETLNFTTGDYPRWIDARPMFNVRDHGGYMTSSGKRIKQGLIYRGGEITPVTGWKSGMQYTGDVGGRYTDSNGRMQDGHITSQTAESKEVFRNVMGMVGGLEIDLRSGSERNGYSACGFANSGDISYSLISISSYDNGMKNNKTQIKQVFEAFAQADTKPVYYHCYGGADRTGVVGFMLGALLGMSYTDLVIDFELTSYSSNPSRNYRSHLRAGPYNYWPRMVTYLQNTLGWNSSKTMAQSIEQYLINDCKVSQTTINKIREIMLED
jgi:protein-tyrosine phosphatase